MSAPGEARECEFCEGTGELFDREGVDVYECAYCEGTGVLLPNEPSPDDGPPSDDRG
jgi:hypothetical protein